MSEQSDAANDQEGLVRKWTLIALIIGLSAGFGFGVVLSAAGPSAASGNLDDDPASVSCTTYVDAQGNASGICFVSGEVEFSWIDGENSTNGTVSLSGPPNDNSTVQREP